MFPPLGLVLTHVPDLATLRRAASFMHAEVLKVCPWGLPGVWWPEAIREVAGLAPTLIYRTGRGDPSAFGGSYPYPEREGVEREVQPWADVRPDLIVELGNEPLNGPAPQEMDPFVYAWHLGQSIAALRGRWPRLRLLFPAFSLHWGRTPALVRWLTILGPHARSCDGVALHAYTPEQLRLGLDLAAEFFPGQPCWLTEAAVTGLMSAEERGRQMLSLVQGAPFAGVTFYHLDRSGAAPLPEHGPPSYQLTDATLTVLGRRQIAPEEPDMDHWPNLRVAGFALDIRRWRTVADFRAHLARYRYADTAPWAMGVTFHHSARPVAADWRGAASVHSLARYYRTNPAHRWTAGPQLFVCPDAPNPEDRGIWQMTPINLPGVHAIGANSRLWGIEMVGNFEVGPLPPDTAALAAGAAAALLDWGDLVTSEQTVTAHRDFNKPECPGRFVDMDAMRRAVAALRQAD